MTDEAKAKERDRPVKPRKSEKPIEITPEMVAAGVFEMRNHGFGEKLEDIVSAVYLAVEIERAS